jgi:hypothetical protein
LEVALFAYISLRYNEATVAFMLRSLQPRGMSAGIIWAVICVRPIVLVWTWGRRLGMTSRLRVHTVVRA